MTRKNFVLVVSYHDGSAVIQAFGPYESEDAAKLYMPDLKDLTQSSNRWDIVPMYDLGPIA